MASKNSIERFKAQFGPGARQNLFEVIFQLPPGLSVPGDAATGETLSFMVKSASIPNMNIAPIDAVYHRGMKIRLSGDPTFAEWPCGFWLDKKFGAYKTMLSWMHLVRDPVTNVASEPQLYKGGAEVHQLDEAGEVLYSVQLNGLWPTDISEVAYDTSAESTIEEFNVTYAYDYFFPLD